MMLPATLEIEPSYMVNIFNQQIVRRQGVAFYALAGNKLNDAVQSPCTPVPSDVVVTLDSVRAIPMPVEEIPLLHIELNTSRDVFTGFVTRHLKTPPDGFEVVVDPPPGSNPPASQQFSKVYTGHINKDETKDVVINIDPNVTVANFSLFDTTRSLDTSVTGASGNKIILDPIKNGVIRIDDPSTMVYLGYGFKQPKPGKWIVTLETTYTTPAYGADYAITAQFNGGALLQTTQDITVPSMNQTVTITGALSTDGASVPLTSASAIIHKPDGSVETLDLAVMGNQTQLKVTPSMSGIYGVEIDVLAQDADGNLIDRAAFLTFDAQPTWLETAKNQILAEVLIVILVVGIVLLASRRRKKTRERKKVNSLFALYGCNMLTEKTFDIGAIKINYAEGPSNGAPFVLLHGATARWQELTHLLDGLEKDWHVYACDTRGHGKSGWGDTYTVTAVANDMAEFIKRNVGEPVVLLGHSAGPLRRWLFAAQIPEWIRSLIVLDPPLLLREQSARSENTNQYFLRVYELLTHQRTGR